MQGVTTVDHPLAQQLLTTLRDKRTEAAAFRATLHRLAALLCYEATRDLPLEEIEIETPVAPARVKRLAGKGPVFVPILRAGLGLLEGMLELFPSADVAHIGLYRDPQTLQPVEYYFKAPPDLAERRAILIDPMVATGGSAVAALDKLKARGVTQLRFICVVASPEGLGAVRGAHADVPIWTAAIDQRLNEHAYIVPGLGDAGDRIYGTK